MCRVSVIEHTDVLIVGLGPAGSRAAAEAARRGCRVIALDRRRRAGFPVQCAEFVPALLGQELAGLEHVTAQRIVEMQTFVEDAAPHVKPEFPGRMIDRGRFDAALVTAAKEAGANCRANTLVAAIEPDGTVVTSAGHRMRGAVLIAADGPRSRVGAACGVVNRDIVETRQIMVPLVAPLASTDIFLAADIMGGYGWLFPKGGVANLGVGVAPAARQSLKPILEKLHAALIDAGRVGAEVMGLTGGAIPVGGLGATVARLGNTPVLLAGDAAGLANPVTGAGISAAVISGELAGEAAARRVTGDESASDDYAEELRDLFKPALDRALHRRRELLAGYDAGRTPSAAALRRGWIAYPEYWAA